MKSVPAPQLTLGAHTHQQQVMISVADNGPGIPEEHLGHIFDPFFTTKAAGSGTGLGLSICHTIISQHEGLIDVDSEIGKGSIFTIDLPAR